MAIPPDPDSVEFAIKRAHLQAFTWLHCCEQNIPSLDPEEFGWKVEEKELKPVWFKGDQFPPSITRRKQKKQADGNEADSESSDTEASPSKKKPRLQAPVTSRNNKNTKQSSSKKKKELKEKNTGKKDKILKQYDSGEEADEELFSETSYSTATYSTWSESDWEVSDFLSSNDSCDEWLP